MRNEMIIIVSLILLVSVIPEVYSDTGTSETTVNNVPPSVVNVSVSQSTVDPEAYFVITTTVRDNNTLNDIDNVIVEVYENGDGFGDSNRLRAHYTFWFDPSDDSWHSDPSTNQLGTTFISTASSQPDDLSVAENDYTFSVQLNGTATPETDWNVYAKVGDENNNSDTLENSNVFSVNNYVSYSVVESKIEWTELSVPSSDNPSDDNPITVGDIETNVSFDVQHSLSGDWANDGGDTIPVENTSYENATGGNSGNMSTTPQDVYTNESYGEDLSRGINYYLDTPAGTSDGTYSTTFFLSVTQN